MGQVANVTPIDISTWQNVAANGCRLVRYWASQTSVFETLIVATDGNGVQCAGWWDPVGEYAYYAACDTSFNIRTIKVNDSDGLIVDFGTTVVSADPLGTGRYSTSSMSTGLNKSQFTTYIEPYSTLAQVRSALAYVPPPTDQITYVLRNCTAPGAPQSAASGTRVTVTITPNAGFAFINPAEDIRVTNNGVAVVASYASGQLHFTMP